MDVDAIAKLAMLELSSEERTRLEREISAVLKMFETLDGAKTDKLEPSFLPLQVEVAFRKDVVEGCKGQKLGLRDVDETENGFVVGPRIL